MKYVDLERLRSGTIEVKDLQDIELKIIGEDEDLIYGVLRAYITGFPIRSKNIINIVIGKTIKPELARFIILEISHLIERCGVFSENIKKISKINYWDTQNIARIQAILTLSSAWPLDKEIKDILRIAIEDENPVIRDAAAVSIQSYSGIEQMDIIWGTGDGMLLTKIDMRILDSR